MSDDDFGTWLRSQVCACGKQATHRQSGRKVCNTHIERDMPATSLDD